MCLRVNIYWKYYCIKARLIQVIFDNLSPYIIVIGIIKSFSLRNVCLLVFENRKKHVPSSRKITVFNLASSIRLESKILLLCESNPSLIGSNSSFTHIYIFYSINNFLWCAFKNFIHLFSFHELENFCFRELWKKEFIDFCYVQ